MDVTTINPRDLLANLPTLKEARAADCARSDAAFRSVAYARSGHGSYARQPLVALNLDGAVLPVSRDNAARAEQLLGPRCWALPLGWLRRVLMSWPHGQDVRVSVADDRRLILAHDTGRVTVESVRVY
jgi:hypothetical protein